MVDRLCARRPTNRDDHAGNLIFTLIRGAGIENPDGQRAVAPDNPTPEQAEAMSLLTDLLAMIAAYKATTGDLWPIPFWGI